jgi:plasmid maintenance system antidote protein VapI
MVNASSQTLTAALRDAVHNSGRTAYAVARAAGVSQAVLSRFLNCRRGITLDTADRLAQALGLQLAKAAPAAVS